jgi:DNA-binding protein H-NS
MPTYQEYQDQIAKLQVLAEEARQDEIADAKKRIRDLMEANGLTATDLQEQASRTTKKKARDVAAKFRDPQSGQTWSGRGRTPRWLDGKNRDDFLIK